MVFMDLEKAYDRVDRESLYEWRYLKVNVGKRKVMEVEREGETGCNVKRDGKSLELVEDFKYLGVRMHKRGTGGK